MDHFSFKNWLLEAGNDDTCPEPQSPTKSTDGLKMILGPGGGAVEGGELGPKKGEEKIPRAMKKKAKNA